MSMEEIDKAMMEMVNGKEPSGAVPWNNEEKIAAAPAEPCTDSAETDRLLKRFELRRKIETTLWALICIAAAAALIAAQYVPAVLPWVLKIGTVIFIVAGAIIIDRSYVRWSV